MERAWNTIDDMNGDINMETFNQIKILSICGNFNFSLPSTLIELYCNNNQLLSLPELPNTLTYLNCSDNQLSSLPELPNRLTRGFTRLSFFHNPFNLWTALIDPAKINTKYAEIIYEKLNVLDYKIKEIEDELSKNISYQYNQKMSELKIEIDKILNFKFEIIL